MFFIGFHPITASFDTLSQSRRCGLHRDGSMLSGCVPPLEEMPRAARELYCQPVDGRCWSQRKSIICTSVVVFRKKPATRQCPSADGTTLFSCLSHFQPTPEPAASLAGSSRPKPDTTTTRLDNLNSYDHILSHPRGCSICLLIPRCLGCRAAKHSRRQPQTAAEHGRDTYLALRTRTAGYLHRLRSSAVCVPSQGNSHLKAHAVGHHPLPPFLFPDNCLPPDGVASDSNKGLALLD